MSPIRQLRIFVSRQIPKSSREALCQSWGPDLNLEWDIWSEDRPPRHEELKERIAKVDAAIILLSDQVDAEILNSAQRLKILANYAVGHNNIDLQAAKERNIVVTNTPDVLTPASADLAFSLLLACARNLLPASRNAAFGQWKGWEPLGFLGTDLRKKTLGIVGMGRIGQEMARLCCKAFAMRILYTAANGEKNLAPPLENAEYSSLAHLLNESDVISLHCPLTQKSKGMLNADMFNLMKKDSYLINTARGELIDTLDLVECLECGKFLGVGLDVTNPEPLPAGHKLFGFSRVVITPHIASATHRARNQMADLCYENILRYFAGHEILTPVTLISV